jgi:hypothetical protein
VRTENIVPDGDECLVWTFSALDPRLSANPLDPSLADLLDALDQADSPDEVWRAGNNASEHRGNGVNTVTDCRVNAKEGLRRVVFYSGGRRWPHMPSTNGSSRLPHPKPWPRLSPRERECMTRLAIDLRHDRIAKRLGINRPLSSIWPMQSASLRRGHASKRWSGPSLLACSTCDRSPGVKRRERSLCCDRRPLPSPAHRTAIGHRCRARPCPASIWQSSPTSRT